MKKEKKEIDKKYEQKFALKTTLRFTDKQLKIINRKKGDLSIPEYCVLTALSSKVQFEKRKPDQHNIDREFLLSISRIGNNINQISRFLNGLPPDKVPNYGELIDKFDQIKNEIVLLRDKK